MATINHYYTVNDLDDYEAIGNASSEDLHELLDPYFGTEDSDGSTYFDDAKDDPSLPEYLIKVKYEGYDDYCCVTYWHLHLPNDDIATELADILDGKVMEGLHNAKRFRITYRNEVYIEAASEKEAQRKFQNMDTDDLNDLSKFVEMVSCEDASTLE